MRASTRDAVIAADGVGATFLYLEGRGGDLAYPMTLIECLLRAPLARTKYKSKSQVNVLGNERSVSLHFN